MNSNLRLRFFSIPYAFIQMLTLLLQQEQLEDENESVLEPIVDGRLAKVRSSSFLIILRPQLRRRRRTDTDSLILALSP